MLGSGLLLLAGVALVRLGVSWPWRMILVSLTVALTAVECWRLARFSSVLLEAPDRVSLGTRSGMQFAASWHGALRLGPFLVLEVRDERARHLRCAVWLPALELNQRRQLLRVVARMVRPRPASV